MKLILQWFKNAQIYISGSVCIFGNVHNYQLHMAEEQITVPWLSMNAGIFVCMLLSATEQ
jgi:hypothetical protein